MSACEYIIVGTNGPNATFNSDVSLTNLQQLKEVEKIVVADKAASIVQKIVRENLSKVDTTGPERVAQVCKAVDDGLLAAQSLIQSRVENMYVLDETNYLRACVPNFVSLPSKTGNRTHPTEKPVELLTYLLALFTNYGNIVLDPFAGSGSLGVGAVTMGRKPILVEKDADFYQKILTRLKTTQK